MGVIGYVTPPHPEVCSITRAAGYLQPYRAGGQSLLRIFPSRPASKPTVQYNAGYIFNELRRINDLRNRIAHHEPVCFIPTQPIKDTTYAKQHYSLLLQLFQWMSIDETVLLYGLDHINDICNRIDHI